jgi:hypothetical protein
MTVIFFCKISDVLVEKWNCIATSQDQKLLFVAGQKGKYAVVGCTKFNSKMRKIAFMKLAFGDYRSVTFMNRLPGSNTLLLGCYNAIVALDFNSTEFIILEKFENLEMGGYITGISFAKDKLFYLGESGDKLGCVKFKGEIDTVADAKKGK